MRCAGRRQLLAASPEVLRLLLAQQGVTLRSSPSSQHGRTPTNLVPPWPSRLLRLPEPGQLRGGCGRSDYRARRQGITQGSGIARGSCNGQRGGRMPRCLGIACPAPACAISANANAYCHEDGATDASSAATGRPRPQRTLLRSWSVTSSGSTSSSLATSGSATRSVTSSSASTAASSSKSAPTVSAVSGAATAGP